MTDWHSLIAASFDGFLQWFLMCFFVRCTSSYITKVIKNTLALLIKKFEM